MATQVQQRRGTTAQHNVFTGANGELTVDTSKDTLVIHDGTTQGGFPLARESDIPTGALASLNSVGASQIDADAITDAKVADNALSGDKIDGGTISNFTSTGIDDNATSTAITIDASENVGIGTISPTGRLNIAPIGNIGGSGGTMSNAGLRIGTTTASSMYLDTNEVHGSETLNFFSNGTDNSVADYIRFSTGGSAGAERMRITSDGRGLSQFTAKAWFNINGSGTVSIRDSHNISSVTDYGVGNYRATFSNSLANANFSFTYGGGDTGGAETTFQLDGIPNVAFAQVQLKNAAGTVTDRPYWTGVIFGD